MKKGLFITFEGIDGAGKSTQIEMLKRYLEVNGETVTVTREPGGTRIGSKIRELLLDKSNSEMCPMAELLLYYADRAQHINECILPLINSGVTVICDRYYDSSYAYQRAGRGLDMSVLDTLNGLVVKTAEPDVTFVLDLTCDVSNERMSGRGEALDRLEMENMMFKENVRHGFLEQAKLFPNRICVVNAMQSPEGIFGEILTRIKQMKE